MKARLYLTVVLASVWLITPGATAAPKADEPAKTAKKETEKGEKTAAIDERVLEAALLPKVRKPAVRSTVPAKVHSLIVRPTIAPRAKTPAQIAVNAHEMEKFKPKGSADSREAILHRAVSQLSVQPAIHPMAVGIGGAAPGRGKRGFNPAVIGGLPQMSVRNAAAINGTAMKRKF